MDTHFAGIWSSIDLSEWTARCAKPITVNAHQLAGGVAIAAGPMVGGFLLTGLGWRSIFLVNIPICALGLGLTLRCVPPAQWDKRKHRTFDLAGQALAIVALTALIGAVIEARPLGLSHPIVAAGILLAFGAGAAFMAVEARTAFPMLPLHFFRRPGFTPAIVFGVLVNCTYYGTIFVLSLYLQKALCYSTIQAGLFSHLNRNENCTKLYT